MKQALRNYWISWLEQYASGRPANMQPHKNVVSWYMTGTPGRKHVFVWVRAVNVTDALITIMEEWPGVNKAERWRIFEQRPAGWKPCPHFTYQRPWSAARMRAALKADADMDLQLL